MKIKVIQSVYCVEPESYKNLAKIDFYLMGRIINKGDIYELKKDNFICVEGKLLNSKFSLFLYNNGFKEYFEIINK